MLELHSFLLIGQSNMAGRADMGIIQVDDICNRILIARMGGWRTFQRPVNPDNKKAGYCLAESFAIEYLKNCARDKVQVGLIPCAYGGSGIREWARSAPNYENAITCAKNAMKTSVICGILWHQGEQDSDYRVLSEQYSERLHELVSNLRCDLNLPEVPFIAGGLGDFLQKRINKSQYAYKVNLALEDAEKTIDNYAFVKAVGLEDIGDNLHFNATSLEEFGKRYFTAYSSVADVKKTYPEMPTYTELYRNVTFENETKENEYT